MLFKYRCFDPFFLNPILAQFTKFCTVFKIEIYLYTVINSLAACFSPSFSRTPEFALARKSLRRIETRQSCKRSLEDCGDGITPMLARALKKKFSGKQHYQDINRDISCVSSITGSVCACTCGINTGYCGINRILTGYCMCIIVA